LATWHPTGPGCWSVTATAREHALRNLAEAEAAADNYARDQFARMAELWMRTAEHDEAGHAAATAAAGNSMARLLPAYEVRTSREPREVRA